MGKTVRFQETLRRLVIIDEGLVEDQAGLALVPPVTQGETPAPQPASVGKDLQEGWTEPDEGT